MSGQNFKGRPGAGATKRVTVKVGMVGDSQVGKTSLMVKYVDGNFDEDYIQTLGTSLVHIARSLFLSLSWLYSPRHHRVALPSMYHALSWDLPSCLFLSLSSA